MCHFLGRVAAVSVIISTRLCDRRMRTALTGGRADDTDAHQLGTAESMPRISIGDCSLYYERHGMGFPVLFVSGLGGFASFWQDQVAAFSKRFEVVTYDLPRPDARRHIRSGSDRICRRASGRG